MLPPCDRLLNCRLLHRLINDIFIICSRAWGININDQQVYMCGIYIFGHIFIREVHNLN